MFQTSSFKSVGSIKSMDHTIGIGKFQIAVKDYGDDNDLFLSFHPCPVIASFISSFKAFISFIHFYDIIKLWNIIYTERDSNHVKSGSSGEASWWDADHTLISF